MRLSSSRLQVVSCIPRCVLSRHRQSGAVTFAGWTSCRVTKLFKVCFTDVDIAGSLVVAVIRSGRSRVNIWQLWDDQHWLRQICRNIAWVRLLGRSTDILQQSVVISLLFWDSSHGLNNICPSLDHDNAFSCFKHPRTHLSTTSTPTCVECAFGSRRTHQSSAAQLSRAYPSNACRRCDRRAAHPCGRVGEDWNNAQQRTSRLQRDSRLLFQEVFEGPRKSVHRLDSTFDLSVALALALGRCFRHNLAVPTIIDSVTEGNNAGLPI